MQIKELRLSHFCGFSDFRLTFSTFTALVGANNGGKTTVLRAIRMICDALEMSLDNYAGQIRHWHDTHRKTTSQMTDAVENLKKQQKQRRDETTKRFTDMVPQERKRQEDGLTRGEAQELANLQQQQRQQQAQMLTQRPKWQCDIAQLVRRQYAENAERFHFRHDSEQPTVLEMDVAAKCGTITIALTLGKTDHAALACLCNKEDLFALSDEQSGNVLSELQEVRCLFVQPIGNLSPSEQSLSWPQVQQHMAQGKEHDVWRNQLHWLTEGKTPEAYQRVIARVQQALGNIRVRPPSRTREQSPKVIVTYEENGDQFDLAEGGAGLRTLLGVAACVELADATVLLFDEPDAHLHSSVQRQLAEFLESQASPTRQIIVATHSPDMIDQFSLDCLTWIDRSRREGSPCGDIGKMMVELGALSHKDALEFQRADSLLYFEAKPDRKAFELLIERCGYGDMLRSTQVVQLGGCGDVQHLPAVARFMEDRHKRRVAMAVVRDADYGRPRPNVTAEGAVLVLDLPCKELENLVLLQAKAILDAVSHAAERRREFTGQASAMPTLAEIEAFIDSTTASKDIVEMVEDNWIVSRLPSFDAGLLRKVREEFAERWKDAAFRRRFCPGKAVLRKLRKWIQEGWQLSFPLPFEYYQPEEEIRALFKTVHEHFEASLKPAEDRTTA